MPFKRLNISSQLISTNTRASTSNVTGALLLSGGAGIRGNVYADNLVVSGSVNAASIITTSGQVLNFPSSGGTIVTTGDTGSITNTMLAGSISNAKLVNTSIIINGTTTTLGNSFTISANTGNTLTIGTGLSGTSFNGSAPITIAIDATVTTNTNTQTLTNKTITGLVSTSTIGDGGANTYSIGFKEIPQSSTTSGNLVLTDSGKHLYVSSGVTVPPNSTAAFNIGTVIGIINSSGSAITITQGSGVTLRLAGVGTNGNRTLSAYGMCTCIKVATDTWYISGSGVT
jgi:hypothetical protein